MNATKRKPKVIKLSSQKQQAMRRFIQHAKRLEYVARLAHRKMDQEFAQLMQD